MAIFSCQQGQNISGSIRVPGDKSISHRSIILASIADGTSKVTGFLEGEDSLNTVKAFQAMGVDIYRDGSNITIKGVGLHGLTAPQQSLDMGNSGTAMRLLVGLLSGQSFDSMLIGDESLSGRPMKRVTHPLQLMGAEIESTENGTAPLRVKGGRQLSAIHYDLPVASAQIKSCILLAGLYADGQTEVVEPATTRDHTERMLRGFGCNVDVQDNLISVKGGQTLKSCEIDVPADISSAAFFMVAASIVEGSSLTLEHVGINPTRTGVIEILKLMGANISLHNEKRVGGEVVADICVKSAKLKGIHIPEHLVPLAIDEFPVLFIAACCAEGKTTLTGAEELRVKESDRIQVMADGLGILGITTHPTDDGIVIEPGVIGSGEVESHGDHRIAMSFAVAALKSSGVISVQNCDNVNTSFPGFAQLANQIGFNIDVTEQ